MLECFALSCARVGNGSHGENISCYGENFHFYSMALAQLSTHYTTGDHRDYPIIPAEDQSQVAAGPDAGSLVEQITYLTSWPQTTSEQVVEITASYH